jgi:membrane-associated protein
MPIIDFIIHIDTHLANIITWAGGYTYLILFAIIFAETGLVVTPLLPGDSLIFAAGALAGGGYLNVLIVYLVLLAAAIIGDSVNYMIGRKLGEKAFANENSKIFKKAYLDRTKRFYEKYGGKTIILARFVPIVRTFAPFVAGVGEMSYKTFVSYNIAGAFLWVTIFTFLGYFFGTIAFVQKNFEFVIIAIIGISLLPMLYEYLRYKKPS